MRYYPVSAGLVASDDLEKKFAMLEGGSVEDDLAALKQGTSSLAGSDPPRQLPEGRPVKDAIDLELEELRQKAKE